MKKTSIFFILFIIFCNTLFAIPAIPRPVTFTQPNGEILTVYIKGDERIHWSESLDGYTLLYNQEGYLTYAQLDEGGNMQPSDLIATNINDRNEAVRNYLSTIEKKLFYSRAQQEFMFKIWQIEDEAKLGGDRGVVGQYKTICAFVQFQNKSFVKTLSQFDPLFNQLGYTGNGTGSVRDFFKEASYNQLDLIITLCGIYTAPQNESYYAGSDGTSNCQVLAKWIAQQVAAEPDINFIDYDSNNDGKVDGFHFIFAGMGQEAGGGSGTIWSHKWQFSPPVTQNGKSISVYSCSPELLWGNTISTIGVIAHEMSHAWGAADFYDTDYESNGLFIGTGNWDIMADGSWNADGNRPAHHNMFVKVQYGWVTPVVLSSPTTVTDMPNAAENPVAYRINTTTNNEYYLLENRQRIKFDTNIPGDGLIIYHVHSQVNNGEVNNKHPQKMYPVCASRNTQMPNSSPSSYGNINSSGCPFPGTSNKTSFTDDSTPAMKSWSNANNNKPITNITHSNKLISFNFMMGGSTTTYTITATAGANGTISPSGTITVNSGDSQKFTATPTQCYQVNQWTVNGSNVQAGGNTYTMNNIQANATINVTFTQTKPVVTFNANGGENVMNPQEFTCDVSQNLTPNSFQKTGYAFAGWNTKENGAGTSYADQQSIAIKENMILFAQWKSGFTITATATEGGEISPNGDVVVIEGGSQRFTITPNITPEGGSHIVDVLVDGISVGVVEEYLFENVNENHTIHAIFEYVGIHDPEGISSFLYVVPNPANDYVELRITNYALNQVQGRDSNIEFYNVFGQLVKSLPCRGEIDDNTIIQRISIADLSSGFYFIKVGNETAKLIKQ